MRAVLATLLGCALALRAAPASSADDWPTPQIGAAVAAENYEQAAALLEKRLEQRPEDLALRFDLARVLGWQGDYEAAAARYDELIARSPNNVDYSLGRAQVLAWALRDREALDELARARSLAPDYEAVWRLEAEILARNPELRGRLSELRERARERFPDSEWWLDAQIGAVSGGTVLTAGIRRETLSRDTPDWKSVFVGLRGRATDRLELYGELRRQERFGLSDDIVAGGASWRVSERLTAGADLSVASDAAFSAQAAAAAWASWALPRGWEAGLRLRHNRYADSTVTGVAVTAARYLGDYRLAYTFVPSHLSGAASAASHSATLDYFRSERVRFRVTIAGGREIESVGPGQVLETEVRAIALSLQHPINERWSVSWQIGSQRQGDLYRRRYIGISVSAGT